MIARCWVCGWSEACASRPAAVVALREHEARAQHPRAWCQDCEREVPTHEGRFPEHFRPLPTTRHGRGARLVRCSLSEKAGALDDV